MREDLLNLLACPRCGASQLVLTADSRNAEEIRIGGLRCPSCDLVMPIVEGAVDALAVASQVARDEIVGNTKMVSRERAGLDDRWLLSLPRSYAELYADKDEAWQNEEREVLALIDAVAPSAGARVLDIGAGTTWSTSALARRGCQAVAIDVSFQKYVGLWSSDVYMRHHHTHYERVAADMSGRLPFRVGTFDAVFIFSALHHAPDPAATLKEIRRVLKPSGTLAFVEATRGWLESDGHFGRRERDAFGINEHKYPLRAYRRWLRQAGFSMGVLVAPSFRAKMDGFRAGTIRAPGPLYFKHRLGRHVARTLWRLPGIDRLLTRAYPLICHVFGAQILAIAKPFLRVTAT